MIYSLCRHILSSGAECRSPALRGKHFCYFHDRFHRLYGATGRPPEKDAPLELPWVEDRSSIQVALSQIVGAIASGRIDSKRAGLILYALQIASQNAADYKQIVSKRAVGRIIRTSAGNELGPNMHHCDPPEDCHECSGWPTCQHPKCLPEEDKEEEEEENEASEEVKAESQPAESGVDALRRECAKRLANNPHLLTALNTASQGAPDPRDGLPGI